jgi:hypothetical protein
LSRKRRGPSVRRWPALGTGRDRQLQSGIRDPIETLDDFFVVVAEHFGMVDYDGLELVAPGVVAELQQAGELFLVPHAASNVEATVHRRGGTLIEF